MPRTSGRRTLAVVILAAGKGVRLKSNLPKALHEVAGRSVLWHVLQAAAGVRPDRTIVVVGRGKEQVAEAVEGFGLRTTPRFVEQRQLLGTGHAVMVAEDAVGDAHDVLVLNGDEPLVTGDQLRALLAMHRRRDVAAVIQTTIADDPRGYARIVRDGDEFVRLSEGSDASEEELLIGEVAVGTYVFRRDDLYGALPLVSRENRQREYYLPDVPGILHEKGQRIAIQLVDNGGAVGVNSRSELARAAAVIRRRIAERHMDSGVTLLDPDTTYIDVGVRIGRDAVIWPHTFLEGATRIGPGARIGPSVQLVDTTVGRDAEVRFAVAREARIGPRVSVGPFASLRQGTELAEGSKAGTFVEMKGSKVGKGTKVPHLTYLGDATVGAGANVGAGTITVNYDGYEKHPTVIGAGARVGSDTMLVAPVKVGRNAYTGAGSAITKNVPAGALGVERSEQVTIPGYAARRASRAVAKAKGNAKRAAGRGRAGTRSTRGRRRG